MSESPDIFLSYNREDQATARRFAEAFEAEGFEVWWDATLRSGEAYDEVTEKALREAKAVVVLWSKKSVVSRWVRAEATLADRNRTLVPAMIEPCERPIMFELTQTADLSRWNGDASDRAWMSFLADVQRFVGAAAAAPNAQSPTPTPVAIAAAPPDQDDHPSLAILPFTNRSGEKTDDVFADGLVEDLISALSLTREIKVIAQSATIVYRKNVSDLLNIGRELGVRYLLEGNVRRAGANLRVSAQLVEAENGAILWTQKFDRPLTELAELQEQLVTEVAAHLGVQVERVEMEKALKKPGDLTAWEAMMRSMAGFASIGRESLLAAVIDARRAVAIAPRYAQGHAILAYALANAFFAVYGGRNETMAREARAHAERALALDANDSIVLGWVALAMGYCGSWREALAQAQRSLELNPNVAITHQALAQAYIRFNRPEDAIAHTESAAIFAPRGYMAYLNPAYRAVAHFQAGRYDKALEAVEQSLQLNPGFVFALKDKAACCEKLGRHEEAREAVRRLRLEDRSLTLEEIEAANAASFMPPETAAEMNAIIRKVWLETPLGPPAA